ncbi:MAG: efflux RND transporter periplasmic adaptor subunit [Vulcanimicrobiota bacterium]
MIFFVAVGLLFLFLVGFRVYQALSKPSGRGRRSRAGAAVQPVAVERASIRRLQFQYDQVGNVESSQNVDIVAKSAGPILELLVRQGDPVRKGQVLVRVDPSQARANLLKKKSDLANAQFTFYQLQSQQQLTDVQASSGVSIARADLEAAQANLQKSRQVYSATRTQGATTVTQAQARLVGARAQLRQAQVDFDTAKAKYERMLGLQRQGFASNADVQDTYRTMLSQDAAVDLQEANVRSAEKDVVNAAAQASKDTVSARADIDVSRFNQVSKHASLAEAEAGTSKSAAFRQQLKAQESLVHAAEADLETAQLQLQDTVLRSPVNGFVSDRKLDVGALASLGTAILTVQSGQQVWVVTSLPQEVFARVDKGHPCEVTIDGLRGQVFAGRVFSKDADIDTATRQFNVRVTLDDQKHLVKPGMFARVKLQVGPPDPQLTIPNAALIDKDMDKRTATVYKVVDKQVQIVTVSYGRSDTRNTVINKGLADGDTVVTQSQGRLKDGQKVDPQSAQAEPGSPSAGSSR